VQFLGVLTRYSTYCFLVIMIVKCYFLPSSVSPVLYVEVMSDVDPLT
jgi:hypothetical protein